MKNHMNSIQQRKSTGVIKSDIYRRNTSLIAGFRIAGVTTAAPAAAASSSFNRRRLRVALARLKMLLQLLLLFICIALPTQCVAVGYSYARFVGPVRGPEHKVLVHDALNGGSHVDYIAKPEYEFAYGVEDDTTHVLQNRQESRVGDEVRGVYSVVDPDGTLRVVKYTADDVNGFQAEVITNGITTVHGHDVPQHVANAADGNDNGNINWQSVHTLQPPSLVQNEVHHTDDATNTNEDANATNADDEGSNEDDENDDGAGQHEVYEEYDESDEIDGKDADEKEESEENDAYEDASKEAQSYENESSDEYY